MHSQPSSSRLARFTPPPAYHDMTHSPDPSLSTHRSSTSSSSNFPPSTTATTPPTSPGLHRNWRPTPNVPLVFTNRRAGVDDEDRNRWLSEDEGLGSSSTIGRRRRRSSHSHRRGNDTLSPPPLPTHQRKPLTVTVAESSKRSIRPMIPRQHSHDSIARSSNPPVIVPDPGASLGVAAGPPRIRDLLPGPGNPVMGVMLASTAGSAGSSNPAAPSVTSEDSQTGPAPSGNDRTGRSVDRGDGRSSKAPSASGSSGRDESGDEDGRDRDRELLQKLRRILSWYVALLFRAWTSLFCSSTSHRRSMSPC